MMDNSNEIKHVDQTCPNCEGLGMDVFYEIQGVPVHSVLLHPTREEAINYPKGDIELGYCPSCGFISNLAFDEHVHEYSAKYDPTQGYSPTFNAFHKKLAQNLIDRYGLRGKKIIEIGCGQGEFLTLLCLLGGNQGLGFDPAYIGRQDLGELPEGVEFVSDFYSEKYTNHKGDMVCCKMTLEHIPNTYEFVSMVRRSIAEDEAPVVFFQVPNARYVFGDIAFWDIYYEHCSYFSLGSLARLFRLTGFDVVDLWTGYDDQYIMLDAKPAVGQTNPRLPLEDDLEQMAEEVAFFTKQVQVQMTAWGEFLENIRQNQCKAVLWGGGSKGVALLTSLKAGLDTIEYAVDINPRKAGTFMAGTGQEIVSPDFLKTYQPDTVLIMNPIYKQEIEQHLAQLGLQPEVRTVEDI
jgi:hypothetical protein